MYSYRRAILWLSQAVAVGALLSVSTVAAQTATSVGLLTIDASLAADGIVQIQESLLLQGNAPLNWTIYGQPKAISVTANGEALMADQLEQIKHGDGVRLQSGSRSAQAWLISYQTSSPLIRAKERDQVYLPFLKEPGVTIGRVVLNFHLPESATGVGLTGNVYAIGGVGRTTVTTTDDRTLTAEAVQLGPKSIITLSAHWPTTVLRLSPLQELRLALANLEILPWLVIGVLLPLLSLLALLRLLARQRHQERAATAAQMTPPQSLSPVIVGALVDKKVLPREIVAMLIDLCRRGYLVVAKKSGQYYLSQRRPFDANLEAWERDILEALFPVANTKVTAGEMRSLNRQSLFSPKVRHAFQAIYDVVTTKNYFAENPHRTRVRYKLSALFLYFACVIGAVWVAVAGATPYLLLPIAGTMIVCRLIIAYTPTLVHYTPAGLDARGHWVAFGRYLAEPSALPLELSRNHSFEKYLAYAIALNVTVGWAKRFDLSNIIIVKPDWYVSYEESSTAEFALEIEEFSASISKILTEMRGPIVR